MGMVKIFALASPHLIRFLRACNNTNKAHGRGYYTISKTTHAADS